MTTRPCVTLWAKERVDSGSTRTLTLGSPGQRNSGWWGNVFTFVAQAPLPPAVADLGARFAALLRERFADDLIGAYVHGSVALHAFDPLRSDVDFVVVLRPGSGRSRGIARIHARLRRAHPLGRRMEGVYAALDALGDPAARHFALGVAPWSRRNRLPCVARRILRARGRALVGPPADDLIPPVSDGQLRAEMAWNLDRFWAARARRLDLLLFDRFVDFAVATLPRILRTLDDGAIISKPEALSLLEAHWPEWADLAHEARGRSARPSPLGPRSARAIRVRRFLQEMLEIGHRALARDQGQPRGCSASIVRMPCRR